ncbi:MAG TPA: hypothetical protein ENN79_02095 [Desulfobacteraceae bacterium]|nr:hypothetical protein [Desulfobacteraceae bacterium]
MRETEATVRKKLNAILEPDGDIGALNLADIIDPEAMQTMMEDFYSFSNIGSAIVDASGKVLVAVGWQDICVKFHRVHPDTAKNIGSMRDITERKRAEKENRKLHEQLTQAQKMESVARLAGGVAHDINNMLGVIMGNAELALDGVPPEDPLHADLKEILDAARRSTDITRQLLAFARKQNIRPDVLDLNESVEGMLKMLRRLIGEDINLSWQPGPRRMPVFMDPSQLDQILANLLVNARDAIGGTGKVSIETGLVRTQTGRDRLDEGCSYRIKRSARIPYIGKRMRQL